MEVLYTYIAYPVFWALYEQQGSRWTLQAMLMNGKIDSIGWEIKPDQMQTIHPLCALLLIFSFNSILFPFLAKFGVRRPLQKLIFSNSLAVVAFLFAAVVQYKIFGESTVIPSDESQLNIFNGLNCNVYVNSSLTDNSTIGPLDSANYKYKPIWEEDIMNITLAFDSSCRSFTNYDKLDATVIVSKGRSISYFLSPTVNKEAILHRVGRYDDFSKPKNGHPSLKVIISDDVKTDQSLALIEVTAKNKSVIPYKISLFTDESTKHVAIGNYNLTRGKEVISSNIELMPATIYTLVIRNNNSNNLESKLYATDKGNYLHMLWQIPQYGCMIVADVIFIATTIEFAFTEAPPRIKSFISACYALTQSFGNLVVVVVSALSFHRQADEYLFFSGLMLADTLLLIYLSSNYKYKNFKQLVIHDSEKIKSNSMRNDN